MNILFVHPNADLYGASRSLLRLVTALDRNVFKPRVILPESGPLLDALESVNVAVDVVSYLGVVQRRILRSWRFFIFLGSLLPSIFQIWRIIIREDIDLVHTNTATTPTPGISARLAGIPHLWHLREMFADDFPFFWRFFAPFMLRFSDKILCVSTPIKAQFQQNTKLEVLYNGIDPNEFIIDSDEIEAWREKLGVSMEKRLVGVASRISPWKGQDIFLQACALLKDKVQNVHYLLVGDAFEGNEYLVDDLHAFVDVNNLNKLVTFTGFIDDPRPVIAALDILVLPSIRPDPFPGIILEAMALGVPIVASNIGGSIEQVDDGRSGLLVPPSNPGAMATAIMNLLNDVDLRQSMAKAGRDRVAKEFTLNATRSRLEDLYQRFA